MGRVWSIVQYNGEFGAVVGVHQGFILSILLLILVLDVLSYEIRTGEPWKLPCADDLVVIVGTLE